MYNHRFQLKNKFLKIEEINRKPTWKSLLITYMNESSVVGFKHLVHKKYMLFERLIWLIMIGLSVIGALYITATPWTRFYNDATVISMERNLKHTVSFCSVSICLEPQLNDTKLSNSFSSLEEIEILNAFASMGPSIFKLQNIENFTKVENKYENHTQYLAQFVNELEIKDIIFFNHRQQIPLNEFQSVLYENGFCYTLQGDISSDFNYRPDNIPKSNISYRFETSTDILLNIQEMKEMGNLYIHYKREIPGLSSRKIELQKGILTKVFIQESRITASKSLQQLSIQQRKCRFYNEPQNDPDDIFQFHFYSYNICLLQCRIRQFLKKCHCRPYMYPVSRQNQRRICNFSDLECLQSIINIFNTHQCKCLPLCEETIFQVRNLYQKKWPSEYMFIDVNLDTFSKIRYTRQQIFQTIDLFVYFGGAASLFLGFSVVSSIEIIYFFILKSFFYLVCKLISMLKQRRNIVFGNFIY